MCGVIMAKDIERRVERGGHPYTKTPMYILKKESPTPSRKKDPPLQKIKKKYLYFFKNSIIKK